MVHRGVIEPIDERLDNDLGTLRLAEELGVRAWELPGVPRKYVNAARIRIEIKHIQAEAQRRADEAARRKGRKK